MTTTRPTGTAIAAGALMLMALVGCGAANDDESTAANELPSIQSDAGDDTATDDPTGDSSEDADVVDPDLAFAEYEKCMEDNGIEMEAAGDGAFTQSVEMSADEPSDGISLDQLSEEAFAEAADACDPILEDAFGSFELSPDEEAEVADRQLDFQKCLKDQGFDADAGEGGSLTITGEFDEADFQAAADACGAETVTPGADG